MTSHDIAYNEIILYHVVDMPNRCSCTWWHFVPCIYFDRWPYIAL